MDVFHFVFKLELLVEGAMLSQVLLDFIQAFGLLNKPKHLLKVQRVGYFGQVRLDRLIVLVHIVGELKSNVASFPRKSVEKRFHFRVGVFRRVGFGFGVVGVMKGAKHFTALVFAVFVVDGAFGDGCLVAVGIIARIEVPIIVELFHR
jgi:hypothetical protein